MARKKKGKRRYKRAKWSVGSVIAIDSVLRFFKMGGVVENAVELVSGKDVSPGYDTVAKIVNDPSAGLQSIATKLQEGGFDYVALFKGPIMYSVMKGLMKLSGNYTDINKILKMGGGRF